MIFIVKISKENFRLFREAIQEIEESSFPSPWSLKAFERELRTPISTMWGVSVNNILSGYLVFWTFADEIHVMNLAIHPDKRGKGLAQYLLGEMIEEGIARGVQKVWLEVRPSNLTAQRLYYKMGFKEISRRAKYYLDTKEDAIIMALSPAGPTADAPNTNAPSLCNTVGHVRACNH